MKTWQAILLGLLALVVLVVLSIGAWQLNWFVAKKNVQKTAQIYEHDLGRQSALRDSATQKVTAIRKLDVSIAETANDPATQQALQAQRVAAVEDACSDIGQIDPTFTLPPNVTDFKAQECNK